MKSLFTFFHASCTSTARPSRSSPPRLVVVHVQQTLNRECPPATRFDESPKGGPPRKTLGWRRRFSPKRSNINSSINFSSAFRGGNPQKSVPTASGKIRAVECRFHYQSLRVAFGCTDGRTDGLSVVHRQRQQQRRLHHVASLRIIHRRRTNA